MAIDLLYSQRYQQGYSLPWASHTITLPWASSGYPASSCGAIAALRTFFSLDFPGVEGSIWIQWAAHSLEAGIGAEKRIQFRRRRRKDLLETMMKYDQAYELGE